MSSIVGGGAVTHPVLRVSKGSYSICRDHTASVGEARVLYMYISPHSSVARVCMSSCM